MRKLLPVFALLLTLILSAHSIVFAQERPSKPDKPAKSQGGMHAQGSINSQEAKLKADERKAQIEQKVMEHKQSIKQEVCLRRQEHLNESIPHLTQGANSTLLAMNNMLERIKGFYEKGQLTVPNYDQLLASAEAAQTDANASVEALNAYEFQLNCESPEAGSQLIAFKIAVNDTKTVLKTYRKTLVDLISSMRAAEAVENQESSESESVNE